ncbi:MAG: hypothetical protein C6I01_01315 [Epsilonproteobacteria bacterium]|jgi:RNA binding exosome subunit|nr:hypothetical protein [Campylobacterota bacterium]NPA89256.1 hypothetical protein [Campylobacterota bacterium]
MNQYLLWERLKEIPECIKLKRAARKAARAKRRAMKQREVMLYRKNLLAQTQKQWKMVPRKEVGQLINLIKQNPEKFIFVYGPRMSGKSFILEQLFTKIKKEKRVVKVIRTIIGKCEKKAPAFHPKYINFRSFLVDSINDLQFALLNSKDPFDKEAVERIKSAGNIFYGFEEEVKRIYQKQGTKVLLIVEEIQMLEGVITPSKQKKLIDLFLNFLIRIGTETEYARVVITSSYDFFINHFYNDPIFRERGEFFKVDHLSYKDMRNLILFYYPNTEEIVIKKIWDVIGGAFPDLWKLIMRGWKVKIEEKGIKGWLAKQLQKKEGLTLNAVEEYLEKEIQRVFAEIKKVVLRDLNEEELQLLLTIAEEITKKGVYYINLDKKQQLEVVNKMVKQNILFFDPLTMEVKGSRRIYEKGLERLYKHI